MQNKDLMQVVDRVPKIIDPQAHAVLDYVTAGSMLAMGVALLKRNRRAANLAFVQGGMILGVSLMTDYPGGVWKRLSFRTHGMLDVLTASMSAMMPALLGFGREPEASLFHGQAAMEFAVVAATDFGDGGLVPGHA